MGKGLFITGTDTDIGKTQVAFGLAAVLRRHFEQELPNRDGLAGQPADPMQGLQPEPAVGLWKPVQSGAVLGSPDADSFRLRQGSGVAIDEADIATVTLPDPLAPWMAARRIGQAIDYEALVAAGRSRLQRYRLLIVEGAGGLAVPLTSRKMIVDLAWELQLPLIIVARPGLGTVNHTLLTVAYAKQSGLRVGGVVLNGLANQEPLAVRENIEMIEQFSETPVLGALPWYPAPPDAGSHEWQTWRQAWTDLIERELKWQTLLASLQREQEEIL